jgi:hypothetical protein
LEYTDTKQFLSRVELGDASQQTLTVGIDFGDEFKVGLTLAGAPDTALEVVETQGSDNVLPQPWRISRSSSPEYLKTIHPVLFDLLGRRGLTELSVDRYKFFHRVLASAPVSSNSTPSEFFVPDSLSLLNAKIRRLIYVPGLRGDQNRKWLLAEIAAHGFFEGPFESYVPSLIDSWVVPVPGERKKIHDLIGALRTLELASGIGSRRLNESEIEVSIPRTSNSTEDDPVNIADVGLAVPTALPVLVALIQADPGQLVYIEQPELHLHPRAQWRLAQLLAQAASRGVRLVIETHSSLLLRGILTQVAESKIASDKVILHWFERDKETGFSKVHSAEPDSAGRVGDWPEDFSDVELKIRQSVPRRS